ncbi:16660_t:CDS:2, partial [Entrophospora sp. SA101]
MHLVSICILLLKIQKTRSCAGISFKTQLLYAIVFVTRYLDLFTTWISVYNTLMKVFFIATSIYILYLMKAKFRATYDPNLDTFRIEYLLGAKAETITTHYLFALGTYRALYLINWLWRFTFEGHVDWIVWIAGAIQTALYSDFFYIYYTRVLKERKKFELP